MKGVLLAPTILLSNTHLYIYIYFWRFTDTFLNINRVGDYFTLGRASIPTQSSWAVERASWTTCNKHINIIIKSAKRERETVKKKEENHT